jgi:voltage-gated potassium channel
MSVSLRRVRMGAVVLAGVFVASVIGYRLAGRDWLDAVYMVVITIATVGYGEGSALSPGEQVLTMAVIVLGISAAVFTLGGFIQMTMEGELERALRLGRTSRAIDKLSSHVILCGFGRMGQILAKELNAKKQDFLVIDGSSAMIAEAQNHGYLVLLGDATDEATLIAAGVERAKTLVTALPNDAANVFITLTARDLNRSLLIVARGEQQSTEKKLLQAGADRVVLPAAIGALRMAAMVTRPSTIELMELVSGQSTLDVEVDEILIAEGSTLIGKSLGDSRLHRPGGLLLVAVKQAAGGMLFNPASELVFSAGDTLVVLGKVEDIDRFRRENRL